MNHDIYILQLFDHTHHSVYVCVCVCAINICTGSGFAENKSDGKLHINNCSQ